jgi:hypothetical protein
MLSPGEVLDHAFLDVRAMLLEIAATLDRYEDALRRAGSSLPLKPEDDPRLEKIYQSLMLLSRPDSDKSRVEKILELFSEPA